MVVLQGAGEWVEVVEFSPDGRALAAVCSGKVQLWDGLTTGHPPAVLGARDICSVRFLPGGRKVLLGGSLGRLVLHDLPTWEVTEFLPQGYLLGGACCDVTPDGRYVVAAHQVNTLSGNRDRLSCLRVADPASPAWSVSTPRGVYSRPLFLGGGGRFVVFERGQGTMVYVTRDTRTGEVVAEVAGHRDQFYDPVVSPDGRLIAARDGEWVEVFWSEDMGAEPVRLRNDNRKWFSGLAFHPSGRYLAVGGRDGTVGLYDTTTWAVTEAYTWGVGPLRSVAFSPDGMLAAAGGDSGKVVVWDVDL